MSVTVPRTRENTLGGRTPITRKEGNCYQIKKRKKCGRKGKDDVNADGPLQVLFRRENASTGGGGNEIHERAKRKKEKLKRRKSKKKIRRRGREEPKIPTIELSKSPCHYLKRRKKTRR